MDAVDVVVEAYAALADVPLDDSAALVDRRKYAADARKALDAIGDKSISVFQKFDLTEATRRTLTVSQEHQALRDAGFSEAVIAKGL